MKQLLRIALPLLTLQLCLLAPTASAQVNLVVYGDQLSNGFQDWSWGTRNLTNTSPVHSGSNSISASLGYWEAVSFAHDAIDTSGYASLSFWLNGGAKGGQVINLQCQLSQVTQTTYSMPALAANQWKQFVIPLTTLGIAGKPDLTGAGCNSPVLAQRTHFTLMMSNSSPNLRPHSRPFKSTPIK